jgi:hypothetical protein
MFTIRANDNLIYNPLIDREQIITANLIKDINIADNFTFTPANSNTVAQNLSKLSTIIEVLDNNTPIFRGRILDLQKNIYNSYSYLCEGELAFFNDSILRPYSWDDGGVQAYLQMIIDNHNSQVDIDHQFTLRNVTVADPNDYIVRSNSEHIKTYDEIKTKLIDLLGGYLFLERINGITYIDYLEDSPYLSNQTIKLGSNIIDLNYFEKGSEIATAILPLGAKVKDEDGNELGRLTIADVNGGIDYIQNDNAVSEYGFILKIVIHEDITISSNLLTKGQQDLAYFINPINSIEINAVDLAQMGVEVDKIRFFDYVKVNSVPHEIEGTLLVTKINIDLLNIANNTLILGSNYGTFTKNNSSLGQRVDAIEGDYVNQKTISDINETIVNLYTSITQTEENIISQVSAEYVSKDQYSTDITNLSTQLEQTNNSFTFTFNQLEQVITDINNELQTQFNEQIKYIRFEDGNIIMGVIGSELILQQANDRISFIQSGVEVAYFSNNKLYVTDGEFLNSLTLGNFAFIPRTNGNLSFKKVK